MSFRSIVLGRAGLHNVLPAVTNVELMQLDAEAVRRYPAAVGHFDHGIFSLLPEGTLRFTIVRDPVQRYLSTVSHMMRDPTFSHLHDKVKDLTFDEALVHPEVMAELRDMVVKLFCQTSVPTGLAGLEEAVAAESLRSHEVKADLELAKVHLDTYEVVGTQEQYADSVHLMLLAAGLQPLKATPVLNDDRSNRQSSASPHVLQRVREAVGLDQQLYDYANGLLRDSLTRTIYHLSMRDYAARQRVLPRLYKFDLRELPGAYGWYAPERDASGTRLWGGSREEQGFVFRVEPDTKYIVAARLDKLDPDKELRVECNIAWAESVPTPSGVVLRFQTGPADQLADVTFIYPNAASPLEAGTGTDQRKLGLVLFEVAVCRVNTFDEFTPTELLKTIHELPPGEIDI